MHTSTILVYLAKLMQFGILEETAEGATIGNL